MRTRTGARTQTRTTTWIRQTIRWRGRGWGGGGGGRDWGVVFEKYESGAGGKNVQGLGGGGVDLVRDTVVPVRLVFNRIEQA